MYLNYVINFNKIVNTHLLVQITFHQFDATTEKNKENQSWAQTHKLQNIHNFLADQKGLVKKQMVLFVTKNVLFLHLILGIPLLMIKTNISWLGMWQLWLQTM